MSYKGGVSSLGGGNTFSALGNNAGNLIFIPVGGTPFACAITPDGNYTYVSNITANTVNVINNSTNTVINTISVGNSPRGIAISPDGTQVWVANSISGNISVISTSTQTVTNTFSTGSSTSPYYILFTPDGTHAYIVEQVFFNVLYYTVSSPTLAKTISLGGLGTNPISLCFVNNNTNIYCIDNGAGAPYYGRISVINVSSNTVTSTLSISSPDVDSKPYSATLSPDGTKVYVLDNFYANIYVFNPLTNTQTETIEYSVGWSSCVFLLNGLTAYIETLNSIVSINTITDVITVVNTLPFSNGTFCTINSVGTKIYFPCDSEVAVFTIP